MTTGRPIAAGLAVLAAAVLAAGCGSSDGGSIDLPPETVTAINAKLDEVQKRFEAGKCEGSGSAQSSLESLREAVNGELLQDVDETLVADLDELLDNLGELIAEQCREPTTTETTDTVPETTDTVPETTDTVPETTDTETTTDTTKTTTTTDTTTDTTTTTPTGPPANPGGGPGGGIAPGGGRNRPAGGQRDHGAKQHGGGKGKGRDR